MPRVARTADGLSHRNTLVPTRVRVRLFDPFLRPMPDVPYRLTLNGRVIEREADGDGWLEVWVTEVPEHALVEWARREDAEDDDDEEIAHTTEEREEGARDASPAEAAPAKPEEEPFLYEEELHVLLDADEDAAAEQRLDNLGFLMGETLSDRIRSYQRAFGKEATGLLADVKAALFAGHDGCDHDTCPPEG